MTPPGSVPSDRGGRGTCADVPRQGGWSVALAVPGAGQDAYLPASDLGTGLIDTALDDLGRGLRWTPRPRLPPCLTDPPWNIRPRVVLGGLEERPGGACGTGYLRTAGWFSRDGGGHGAGLDGVSAHHRVGPAPPAPDRDPDPAGRRAEPVRTHPGQQPWVRADLCAGDHADVWTASGERMSSVADRTEIAQARHATPREATLQGPLKAAITSISAACWTCGPRPPPQLRRAGAGDIREVEVTVAAITAADSRIRAAARRFAMKGEGDDMSLCPQNLYARQIRSRWRRADRGQAARAFCDQSPPNRSR